MYVQIFICFVVVIDVCLKYSFANVSGALASISAYLSSLYIEITITFTPGKVIGILGVQEKGRNLSGDWESFVSEDEKRFNLMVVTWRGWMIGYEVSIYTCIYIEKERKERGLNLDEP